MRKFFLALAIILVAFTAATTWPTSDLTLARGDLESLKDNGKLVLSGSDPGWATTNNQIATRNDFTTYFKNTGSCPGAATSALNSAQMQACAVLTSVHSPLINSASNTFQSGAFTSWTSSVTPTTQCLSQAAFAGNTGTGEDGAGYASSASGTGSGCNTGVTQTLSQTFTVSGTPTSPTFSFWYMAPSSGGSGDAVNCNPSTGTVNITLKINSTVDLNAYSATTNGAWHQVTGTASGMVNGTNTLTFTLAVAQGVNQTYNGSTLSCNIAVSTNQFANIDNVVLSATY